MHKELTLLLTLLDRPGDVETRLVYADWLEDDGQDELAKWQRLHAAVLDPATGNRRVRHHQTRLQELLDKHRTDWIEVGGTLLTWPSVLMLFGQRLAETAAWLTQREGKSLHSPELMPGLPRGASAIEPLWRCRRPAERTGLVHAVATRRASQLGHASLLPVEPASDLMRGRLLLFDPDAAFGGTSGAATAGMLDSYSTPACDTWLFYFSDGPDGHCRVHQHWEAEWIMNRPVEPVPMAAYLAAWVPPALAPVVEWERSRRRRPAFNWAENVDCNLSTRLRELGWFQGTDPVKVDARIEKRIGFAQRDAKELDGLLPR